MSERLDLFFSPGQLTTSKRFVRKRTWKGNIMSRNCSKYNFLSPCPNNDIERSVFVWRRWYSGEHSCLPSSWPGLDSRPTQHFGLVISSENIEDGSSGHSLFFHGCAVILKFAVLLSAWNSTKFCSCFDLAQEKQDCFKQKEVKNK